MSRIIRAAMMLGLLSALPLARPARAELPSDAVMDSLMTMAQDTLRAPVAEARLRRVLLDVEPRHAPMIRHLITLAVMHERASTDRLLALADSALADTALHVWMRSQYTSMVAYELLTRNERLDWADNAVRQGLAARQESPTDSATTDEWIELRARILMQRDMNDSAIAVLEPRVAVRPEAMSLLWYLGVAYRHADRLDEAIDMMVRRDAVTWSDTSVAPELREAWTARHGSLDGLAERLAESRGRARRVEVFERDRVDRPAPEWSLPALDGRRRSSRELAGKLVVLEFWGTWCPGCLINMPDLLKLLKQPRFRGVTLLTVNCEPPGTGADPRGRVRALMREKRWTFPVVQDTTSATEQAFGVRGFPTAAVIDRRGVIRFMTMGWQRDADVVGDQLAALLEEERASKRR